MLRKKWKSIAVAASRTWRIIVKQIGCAKRICQPFDFGGVDVVEMLVYAAACADLTPCRILQVRLRCCCRRDFEQRDMPL